MNLSHFSNLFALTVALVLPALLFPVLGRWLGSWARDVRFCGTIGVSLMLLMSASAHFLSTEDMALMLPDWAPIREWIVVLTGIWVLFLAIAVLVPRWRQRIGLLILLTLIAFLPANIYAAWLGVPYGGNVLGPAYLLVRVPFQIFLLIWVAWSTNWVFRNGVSNT